ncbi:hypothetical protein Tco_0769343 [Tanacetum coccineum]|uniref:Uncharacterized protein n=1 Tax=Tanacetum coccineum TaxID=301880 RepID=A0ABQ4ZC20_9ASTR
MSEKKDTYHDTILDLEAKLKKNVDLILKLGNSLQGMFMLGPKPLSVYDQQLKHGLGYPNPYTLKQAISKCPKLYVASSLGNLKIPLNVRDSENILEDVVKSQQKMTAKMNDPIAVANKQSCWTINYKKLNALYEDYVPQKSFIILYAYGAIRADKQNLLVTISELKDRMKNGGKYKTHFVSIDSLGIMKEIESSTRNLEQSNVHNSHQARRGIDLEETFAPVARLEAVQKIHFFAAHMKRSHLLN